MPDNLVPPRRWWSRPWTLVDPTRAIARAAGFWLAVVLPFAYLALVVVAPAILADPLVLGGAVAANLLALVVGHGHEPSLGRFGGRD